MTWEANTPANPTNVLQVGNLVDLTVLFRPVTTIALASAHVRIKVPDNFTW